ncbi:MAG: YbhB/YbcL family Raf kinase inhibitor-like protein [Actinomycetota bacterium]
MSRDFEPKGKIPGVCTCDGEDRRPELHWSGIPDGTAELALICEDLDAPGGTFVHWTIWGLDPAMTSLGADPPDGAVEGINDFENLGYGGPCPPPKHGYHHYHFRLYALSDHLKVPPGASITEVRRAMDGKVLDMAELVGVYARGM